MQSPQGMVFAICHEVGNLLAAIRLHGELLDPDSGATIAELSARSGSLISLVRPLVDDQGYQPLALDPSGLLEGLRTGLGDPDDPRLELAIAEAEGLPAVRVDGEVLHHLLLSQVFASFEKLSGGERLRVAARLVGDSMEFEIVGGEPRPAPGSHDRLTGCALCDGLAVYLLEPIGGRVTSDTRDGRHRLALIVPLA